MTNVPSQKLCDVGFNAGGLGMLQPPHGRLAEVLWAEKVNPYVKYSHGYEDGSLALLLWKELNIIYLSSKGWLSCLRYYSVSGIQYYAALWMTER